MRAAAEIVREAVTAVEIVVAAGVRVVVVGVVAGAVGVRAAVAVEIAVAVDGPEAGAAEGGTNFLCGESVATDLHGFRD